MKKNHKRKNTIKVELFQDARKSMSPEMQRFKLIQAPNASVDQFFVVDAKAEFSNDSSFEEKSSRSSRSSSSKSDDDNFLDRESQAKGFEISLNGFNHFDESYKGSIFQISQKSITKSEQKGKAEVASINRFSSTKYFPKALKRLFDSQLNKLIP